MSKTELIRQKEILAEMIAIRDAAAQNGCVFTKEQWLRSCQLDEEFENLKPRNFPRGKLLKDYNTKA